MAEPATENPPPPAGGRGKKRGLPPKLLGLPTPVVLAGATAGAVLIFLWVRSRKSGDTGSTTPTASATAATADAADLAALQSELDQLTGGGSGSGGGFGGGGSSSVVTTSTPTSGTTAGNPTSTATSTTGGSPVKLAKNPVSNLRITDDGYTSLTAEWDKSPNATAYLISILQGGKVIKQQHAVGAIARVGNLKRGTTYDFRVRAQPGGTGGRDANVTATTKKG